MTSLNFTTLRKQNYFESLIELNKAYGILKEIYYEEIYYEKEQKFICYNYSTLGSYLEEHDNRWISEIWDEKDLYFYIILDKNRNELFNGTYLEIIKTLKLTIGKIQGRLILTAFKVRKPKSEVAPVLTVTGKTTDSEKIKKLETDISEIKELLKKMVV